MKKHIIAAAVAAAVAVPAMAQNVSVSGVLETGYQSSRIGGVNDSTVSPAFFTTNEIRFSGTEDLGGGLKATFTLVDEFATNTGAQTGVNAAGTAVLAASTATGNTVFEESSLQLSGDFGAVKAGRFNFASRDNSGVYRFGHEFARLSGNFRNLGSQPSNSIQYTSPSYGGFTVAIASSNGGARAVGALQGTAVTNTVANQLGYRIAYANGPLQIAYASTSADTGAMKNNTESHLGGQYDFGSFKLGLQYSKETPTTTLAEEVTATVVNVLVPMGGFDLHASYHAVSEETAGTATLGAIAVTKDLSKRTTLYAGYIGLKNGTGMGTAYAVNGIGTALNNDSVLVGGVRHRF